MKLQLIWPLTLFAIFMVSPALASIDEVGDLNIINDAANPSDGLRYLDMSFSDGMGLADALIGAQAAYPNARLATPSEWDDLFSAAGISYVGSVTASDAFTALGDNQTIASGGACCASLVSALGGTSGANTTWFWSAPDGSDDSSTTYDLLRMSATNAVAQLRQRVEEPPWSSAGFLLVSDIVVPIPPAIGLFGTG